MSVGRLSNGSKPQPVKLTATRTDLAGQTSHQARNQQINSTSDDSFGEVPTSESFTNRSVRTGNESFYSREKLRLSLQQQQHGSRNSLKGESSSGRDSEIIMQANGGKSLIDFNNQGQ